MTVLQALILSIVQGVTELFPVSSLGHAVLLPRLLGWRNFDQDGDGFLPFLVVMHLGTAVALFLFFWRDWWSFGRAVLLNRGFRARAEKRIFWRLVVATIPAVILGAGLHHLLKSLFAAPVIAAAFLIVNGVILFVAERLKRRLSVRKSIDQLSLLDALIIGAWQSLALIPGISRSGTTMVGGLLQGMDHEDSARFSFLAATPVIIGATVFEAPKLLHAHTSFSSLAILSGVVAGVAAFLSVWALMSWFKRHEFKAFDPFAFWCWGFGAVSLAWLLTGH